MALVPTLAGPAVGLQIEWCPDGYIAVSVHTSAGYLVAHLSAQEAHQTTQTLLSILRSHRAPEPSPCGEGASPFPPRLPRSGEPPHSPT